MTQSRSSNSVHQLLLTATGYHKAERVVTWLRNRHLPLMLGSPLVEALHTHGRCDAAPSMVGSGGQPTRLSVRAQMIRILIFGGWLS